ncbi:MAG: NAD(P)-binding domain-containing protein [Solirubrobacteraceae bacterium]
MTPAASLPPAAGVLGSGQVGKTLAAGLAAKGIPATLGTSRAGDPELAAWAQEAGVRLGSFAEAASAGDMVFLAVRGASDALHGVIDAAGPGAFNGKIVVDATNPLVFGDTMPPGLEVGHTESAGEHLQQRLPGARVVKAFNTVGNTLMVDPDLPGGPPDMLIAGNDADAKAEVTAVLAAFGWPAIDVGGIERSRELESLCVLWVAIGLQRGSWDHAFKVLAR